MAQRINWTEPLEQYNGMTRSEIAVNACVEIVKSGNERYLNPALKLLRESYPDLFTGLTYNSLNNHLRQHEHRKRIQAHHPDMIFEQRSVEQLARRQVQHLEAEIKAAAKQKGLEDRLVELFGATIPALEPAPALWKPSSQASTTKEALVSLVSDIHGYEHVSTERTRGHNMYTPTVMCRRIGNLVAAEHSIVHALRSGGWVFPNRVIALLGDNVSGTIHELERHAHGMNVVLAVDGVAYMLAQYVREVARMHERVYIVGVSGNHGRLPDARRKQMKDPTRTWDYMIYLMMRAWLRDLPNVEMLFPNAWSVQVEIEGRQWLFNHGDDVRSWNSIPWYGIERRTNRIVALEAARKNLVDYQCFGHFHSIGSTPNPVGETFINGCVIGVNEYALEALAVAGPPTQWMLQAHKDFGITGRWPLRLDIDRPNAPAFTASPWEDVQRDVELQSIPSWKIGQ